ncbi:MAG: hypothetical protein H0W59_00110 [Chloroflexia bacterium]|jgi:hypothetical protein|nr:hypothetical protein [Chloroflexia bacterium]
MAHESISPNRPGATARGTIVVLNRDLMFGSRIRHTVRALGYDPLFTVNTLAFIERIRSMRPPAVLAILDMNGVVDWELIGQYTTDPGCSTPLLGFGPHVDIVNRRAAKAAGVSRIVSNGQFHSDTAGIVQRYARDQAANATNKEK